MRPVRRSFFYSRITAAITAVLVFSQSAEARLLAPVSSSPSLGIAAEQIEKIFSPWGTLSRFHPGRGEGMILLIQDAHANEEAQRNIANLLVASAQNFGIRDVGVEGASGDLNTAAFAFMPDKDARAEAADYFLKEGRLTGPEYTAVVMRSDLRLTGLESREAYEDNRKAFLEVLEVQDRTREPLKQLDRVLGDLSRFILPAEARELFRLRSLFEQDPAEVLTWAEQTAALAVRHGLSLERYSELRKLLDLRTYAMDASRSEETLSRFENQMARSLQGPALRQFLRQQKDYRNHALSAAEYAFYLESILDTASPGKTPDAGDAGDAAAALEYLKAIASFSTLHPGVLDELRMLDEEVMAVIVESAEEKKLAAYLKLFGVLRKLFTLRWTRADAEYFYAQADLLGEGALRSFCEPLMKQHRFSYSWPEGLETLIDDVKTAEDFYAAALKRDPLLVEHAVRKLRSLSSKRMAVVAGGFHTAAFERKLKEQGIAYAVLSPRINGRADGEREERLYESALLGTRLPIQAAAETLSTEGMPDIADSRLQLNIPLMIPARDAKLGDLFSGRRETSLAASFWLTLFFWTVIRSAGDPAIREKFTDSLQKVPEADLSAPDCLFLKKMIRFLGTGVFEKEESPYAVRRYFTAFQAGRVVMAESSERPQKSNTKPMMLGGSSFSLMWKNASELSGTALAALKASRSELRSPDGGYLKNGSVIQGENVLSAFETLRRLEQVRSQQRQHQALYQRIRKSRMEQADEVLSAATGVDREIVREGRRLRIFEWTAAAGQPFEEAAADKSRAAIVGLLDGKVEYLDSSEKLRESVEEMKKKMEQMQSKLGLEEETLLGHAREAGYSGDASIVSAFTGKKFDYTEAAREFKQAVDQALLAGLEAWREMDKLAAFRNLFFTAPNAGGDEVQEAWARFFLAAVQRLTINLAFELSEERKKILRGEIPERHLLTARFEVLRAEMEDFWEAADSVKGLDPEMKRVAESFWTQETEAIGQLFEETQNRRADLLRYLKDPASADADVTVLSDRIQNYTEESLAFSSDPEVSAAWHTMSALLRQAGQERLRKSLLGIRAGIRSGEVKSQTELDQRLQILWRENVQRLLILIDPQFSNDFFEAAGKEVLSSWQTAVQGKDGAFSLRAELNAFLQARSGQPVSVAGEVPEGITAADWQRLRLNAERGVANPEAAWQSFEKAFAFYRALYIKTQENLRKPLEGPGRAFIDAAAEGYRRELQSAVEELKNDINEGNIIEESALEVRIRAIFTLGTEGLLRMERAGMSLPRIQGIRDDNAETLRDQVNESRAAFSSASKKKEEVPAQKREFDGFIQRAQREDALQAWAHLSEAGSLYKKIQQNTEGEELKKLNRQWSSYLTKAFAGLKAYVNARFDTLMTDIQQRNILTALEKDEEIRAIRQAGQEGLKSFKAFGAAQKSREKIGLEISEMIKRRSQEAERLFQTTFFSGDVEKETEQPAAEVIRGPWSGAVIEVPEEWHIAETRRRKMTPGTSQVSADDEEDGGSAAGKKQFRFFGFSGIAAVFLYALVYAGVPMALAGAVFVAVKRPAALPKAEEKRPVEEPKVPILPEPRLKPAELPPALPPAQVVPKGPEAVLARTELEIGFHIEDVQARIARLTETIAEIPVEAEVQKEVARRMAAKEPDLDPSVFMIERYLEQNQVSLEFKIRDLKAKIRDASGRVDDLKIRTAAAGPEPEAQRPFLLEIRKLEEFKTRSQKELSEAEDRLAKAIEHRRVRADAAEARKAAARAPELEVLKGDALERKRREQTGNSLDTMFWDRMRREADLRPGSSETLAVRSLLEANIKLLAERKEGAGAAAYKDAQDLFFRDFADALAKKTHTENEFSYIYFRWKRLYEHDEIVKSKKIPEAGKDKMLAYLQNEIVKNQIAWNWYVTWRDVASDMQVFNREGDKNYEELTRRKKDFLEKKLTAVRAANARDPFIGELEEHLARFTRTLEEWESRRMFEQRKAALNRILNYNDYLTLRKQVLLERIAMHQKKIDELERETWLSETLSDDVMKKREDIRKIDEQLAVREVVKAREVEYEKALAEINDEYNAAREKITADFAAKKMDSAKRFFLLDIASRQKSWKSNKVHFERQHKVAVEKTDDDARRAASSGIQIAELHLKWYRDLEAAYAEFNDYEKHPERNLEALQEELNRVLADLAAPGLGFAPKARETELRDKREELSRKMRETRLRWQAVQAAWEERKAEEVLDALHAGLVTSEDARRAVGLPAAETPVPEISVRPETTEAFRRARVYEVVDEAVYDPVIALTLDWEPREIERILRIMVSLGMISMEGGKMPVLDPDRLVGARDFALYFAKIMRERGIQDKPNLRFAYLNAYHTALVDVVKTLKWRGNAAAIPDENRLPLDFGKDGKGRFTVSHLNALNEHWNAALSEKGAKLPRIQDRFSLPSILGLTEAKVVAFEKGSVEYSLSQLRLKEIQQLANMNPWETDVPPLMTLMYLLRKGEIHAELAEYIRWQPISVRNSLAFRQILKAWYDQNIGAMDQRFQILTNQFARTKNVVFLNQLAAELGYGSVELFILQINHEIDMLHVPDPLFRTGMTNFALRGPSTYSAEWVIRQHLTHNFPFKQRDVNFSLLKWYMVHNGLKGHDLQDLARREAATIILKMREYAMTLDNLFTLNLEVVEKPLIEFKVSRDAKGMVTGTETTYKQPDPKPFQPDKGFNLLLDRLKALSKSETIGTAIPVMVQQGYQNIIKAAQHDIVNDEIFKTAIERLADQLKRDLPDFATEETRGVVARMFAEEMASSGIDFTKEEKRADFLKEFSQFYDGGGKAAVLAIFRPEFGDVLDREWLGEIQDESYKRWDIQKWQRFRNRLRLVVDNLPDIENVRLKIILNLLDEIDPQTGDKGVSRRAHLNRVGRDFILMKLGYMGWLPDVAYAENYLETHYFEKEIAGVGAGVWTGRWLLRTNWELDLAFDQRARELYTLLAKETRHTLTQMVLDEAFLTLKTSKEEKRPVIQVLKGPRMSAVEIEQLESELWVRVKPLTTQVAIFTAKLGPAQRNPGRLYMHQTRQLVHDMARQIEARQISKEAWLEALAVASNPQFQEKTLRLYRVLHSLAPKDPINRPDFFEFLLNESEKYITDTPAVYIAERQLLIDFFDRDLKKPLNDRETALAVRDVRATLKATEKALGVDFGTTRGSRIVNRLERTLVRSILVRAAQGGDLKAELNRLYAVRTIMENRDLAARSLDQSGVFWQTVLGPDMSPEKLDAKVVARSGHALILYWNYLLMGVDDDVDGGSRAEVEASLGFWLDDAVRLIEHLKKKPEDREKLLQILYERLRVQLGAVPDIGFALAEPGEAEIKALREKLSYFVYLQEYARVVRQFARDLRVQAAAAPDPAAVPATPAPDPVVFWDRFWPGLGPADQARFDFVRQYSKRSTNGAAVRFNATPQLDPRDLNLERIRIPIDDTNSLLPLPPVDVPYRTQVESFYLFEKGRWTQKKMKGQELFRTGPKGRQVLGIMGSIDRFNILSKLATFNPAGFRWERGPIDPKTGTRDFVLGVRAQDAALFLPKGHEIHLALSAEDRQPWTITTMHTRVFEDAAAKRGEMILFLSLRNGKHNAFAVVTAAAEGNQLVSLDIRTEFHPILDAKGVPTAPDLLDRGRSIGFRLDPFQHKVKVSRTAVADETFDISKMTKASKIQLDLRPNEVTGYIVYDINTPRFLVTFPDETRQYLGTVLTAQKVIDESGERLVHVIATGDRRAIAGTQTVHMRIDLARPGKDLELPKPVIRPLDENKLALAQDSVSVQRRISVLRAHYFNNALFKAQDLYDAVIGPEFFSEKKGEKGFPRPNLKHFLYDDKLPVDKQKEARASRMTELNSDPLARGMLDEVVRHGAILLPPDKTEEAAEVAKAWNSFSVRLDEAMKIAKEKERHSVIHLLSIYQKDGLRGRFRLLQDTLAGPDEIRAAIAKLDAGEDVKLKDIVKDDQLNRVWNILRDSREKAGSGRDFAVERLLIQFHWDAAAKGFRSWLKDALDALMEAREAAPKDAGGDVGSLLDPAERERGTRLAFEKPETFYEDASGRILEPYETLHRKADALRKLFPSLWVTMVAMDYPRVEETIDSLYSILEKTGIPEGFELFIEDRPEKEAVSRTKGTLYVNLSRLDESEDALQNAVAQAVELSKTSPEIVSTAARSELRLSDKETLDRLLNALDSKEESLIEVRRRELILRVAARMLSAEIIRKHGLDFPDRATASQTRLVALELEDGEGPAALQKLLKRLPRNVHVAVLTSLPQALLAEDPRLHPVRDEKELRGIINGLDLQIDEAVEIVMPEDARSLLTSAEYLQAALIKALPFEVTIFSRKGTTAFVKPLRRISLGVEDLIDAVASAAEALRRLEISA